MLSKTQGLVLHSTKYSETSLIVHMYTLHFGRQSYIIRGIRKGKGRNRMALFQPLNILELEVSHSEKREIQHLRETSILNPSHNITGNPVKETMALFMAEVLYRCLREPESNPALFQFLLGTVQVLDLGMDEIPNLHLYFLVQLTRFLGFSPEQNQDEQHPRFDMYAGRFTAAPADEKGVLDNSSSARMGELLKLDQSGLRSLQMKGSERSELAGILIDYYRIHLEGMGTIKTLEIMREIFRA
ncbi:MAG: DNA repair protein RecO [Bacteroidales bacterium]